MEANGRAMMQVLLLTLVVQVALSQHWSYGWLPGGKRSVGELEATIRVRVLFFDGPFIKKKKKMFYSKLKATKR